MLFQKILILKILSRLFQIRQKALKLDFISILNAKLI
jgi:hypothetical protein